MQQYLVHYDSEKSEIQLRIQHSVALGFCHIKESIPINKETIPKSTIDKNAWLLWHDKWKQYFIRKYNLNPNNVQ